MLGPAEHPLREALTREIHARPFAALTAPAIVSHVAMLSRDNAGLSDHAHLVELCKAGGVIPPPSGVVHALIDFGAFRLKWERHGEFCSWTVFVEGTDGGEPFDQTALAALPPEWLAGLPGQWLVAVHVVLEPKETDQRRPDDLAGWFNRDSLAGSRVADSAGEVWTDFRVHEGGFNRVLVQDRGFVDPFETGVVVQRILEIETYRMMALLALPVAREAGPRISAIDNALAPITQAMGVRGADTANVYEERHLLERLIELAGEIEQIMASSDYRFGAARAYHALIDKRIAELGEEHIQPGVSTVGEFMDRRLAPAMRSCAATSERLRAMAERLARASTLLRTRVDIALEAQNQDLLASMNRRAKLQLRLQQTVEGLSVAAISYYVIGLLGYALRAIADAGIRLRHDLITGIAIPLVLLSVWWGVSRLRRRITATGDVDPEL